MPATGFAARVTACVLAVGMLAGLGACSARHEQPTAHLVGNALAPVTQTGESESPGAVATTERPVALPNSDVDRVAVLRARTNAVANQTRVVPMTMVTANIPMRLSRAQLASDLANVYSSKPDFVTLNEVQGRADSDLLAAGYALHRTPGTYTGASPVIWNSAKWTMLASGTFQISNVMGKGAQQDLHWGIRYANWVTLRGAGGETLSVVATHFSPVTRYTPGITVPSIRKLGELTATLKASGPVLVGGDLNMHYRSANTYQRAEMTAQDLTPTFDLSGVAPPTDDYGNATIDYLLMRPATNFKVTDQWTTEQYSDHKMLGARLSLTVNAPKPVFTKGWVSNSSAEPTKVIRYTASVLNKATKGANVRIATRAFEAPRILKAIRAARKRGVNVMVIVGSPQLNKAERTLKRELGTRTGKKSWFAVRPRYWRARPNLARTVVTASETAGVPAVRLDLNVALKRQKFGPGMAAKTTVDKVGYDWFFTRFVTMQLRSS